MLRLDAGWKNLLNIRYGYTDEYKDENEQFMHNYKTIEISHDSQN